MALGFTKPRYSPIAIDFGADTLKVLQVSLGDPPQLIASASRVIPELYRDDGAGRMTYLADALRDLLKTQPFKGKRAICSIPAYQTLIQHLELTKAENDDFDQQVGLQLIQRFNIDPSRMVVRSHRVGKLIKDGSTMYQVVCIAARRDAVMKYIELANRCKLEVVGMHSEPMAIVRAHPLLAGKETGSGTTCYIDIGAGMTKLIVAHGQELAFAKTVHACGNQLTRALAQMQGIGFDQARKLRSRNVSAGVGAGHVSVSTLRAIADDDDAADEAPASAPGDLDGHDETGDTIESLIDELRLSMRYYHNIFPNRPIQQLIFLGGESQDVKLCQSIARSVRVAAKLGDPFAGVDTLDNHERAGGIEPYKPMPGWAVPLGLCFSEANL
ncbi:MAG: pilus assembly protein PilM [Phycisphaerales bacterium]